MLTNIQRLGIFYVLLCVGSAVADENDVRTWADTTGKFSVRAVLINHDAQHVQLRAENEKVIRVPIAKLSESDQRFLRKLDSKPELSVSPKATKPHPTFPAVLRDAESSVWDDVVELDLSGDDFWAWPEELSANKNASATGEKFQSINVPLNDFSWPTPQSVIVDSAARTALIAVSGRTKQSKNSVLIAAGNLSSGELTDQAIVSEVSATAFAYSAKSKIAWMAVKKGWNSQLEGWRFANGKVERGEPWKPFQSVPPPAKPKRSKGVGSDLRFGFVMAGDSLVIGSDTGQVVVWDLQSLTPRIRLHTGERSAWAITPNGRLIALATSQELTIVDVPNAKLVAKRSLDDLGGVSWPKLDFSPDLSELFLSSVTRNILFSTATGDVVDDFVVSGLATGNGAIFPNQDFLLVDGSALVDRRTHQIVWRLKGLGRPISLGDYTLAVAHDDQQCTVLPVKLPTSSMQNAIAKQNATANQTDDQSQEPAKYVAIEIDGAPEKFRQQIDATLRKKLTATGYTVADAAPVILRAKLKGPGVAVVNYADTGDIRTTVWMSNLSAWSSGKEFWQEEVSNLPLDIDVVPGKAVEETVRELTRDPNLKFFGSVDLSVILKNANAKNDANAIGVSRLTTQGLQ